MIVITVVDPQAKRALDCVVHRTFRQQLQHQPDTQQRDARPQPQWVPKRMVFTLLPESELAGGHGEPPAKTSGAQMNCITGSNVPLHHDDPACGRYPLRPAYSALA